ncbi:hypothetical protein B0H10DRAFT_1957028 [Mycena sp. CBHHK59/15]|nr:hypothetical protein B0H10DRAFT_1957028 [Mycena sp. CBHHK59/15]
MVLLRHLGAPGLPRQLRQPHFFGACEIVCEGGGKIKDEIAWPNLEAQNPNFLSGHGPGLHAYYRGSWAGPGMLLVLPNGRITHSLCHKTPVTSFPHPFSRRALVVEGPEQSDHSDAPDLSDDDSFMNLDSPIPSPKAPQDYDSELELPTVEWRSPSPLEYIPDSDLPSTQIGPLLQSVPETEDLADHDEQENGSSAPATMPDAVSSAPTSSESAPPGITVTPNLGAEPTARRSGRKRKEREELKDLSAALSACICGSSAAPLDSSEHPNVAITWYDVVGIVLPTAFCWDNFLKGKEHYKNDRTHYESRCLACLAHRVNELQESDELNIEQGL